MNVTDDDIVKETVFNVDPSRLDTDPARLKRDQIQISQMYSVWIGWIGVSCYSLNELYIHLYKILSEDNMMVQWFPHNKMNKYSHVFPVLI